MDNFYLYVIALVIFVGLIIAGIAWLVWAPGPQINGGSTGTILPRRDFCSKDGATGCSQASAYNENPIRNL